MVDRSVAPAVQKLHPVKIPRVTLARLQNGVPLNYLSAGTQPVCKLELIFNTGKWHETKPGVSFLTFKMLQEGTKSRSSFQISETFDKTGSYLGIEPGIEFSSLELFFLNNKADLLIPLLREMIYEPVFPKEELRKQKRILSQNIKIELKKNSVLASRLFRRKLFGSHHPYGSFLEPELIKEVTRDDLLTFYEQNILNAPLEIIASGLIDDTMISLLEENFGSTANPSGGLPVSFEPVSDLSKSAIERKGSSQSSIRIGKFSITKSHPEIHKLYITNEILGGYFGSRLMQNIRETKGLTYGIYSSLVTSKNYGYLVISADAKKELRETVVEEVFKEIELLQTKGVSDSELSIVKNYLFGEFLGEVNTAFNLAAKFRSIHLYGLGYDFYDQYFETLETITSGDIQQMVRKYFDPQEMMVVSVG